MSRNPYRWDTDEPERLIELPVFGAVREALLQAERLVLVGGHGMGKTVLLRWLREAFNPGDVRVELISSRPHDYSVSSCVRQLARKLGETRELDDITELFEGWFERDGRHLVLLYDEIDRYVDDGDTAMSFLNALAKAHESNTGQLGIAVAGGLGVYQMEAELGSPYTSRALWEHLAPFTREHLITLAQPFDDDRQALSDEALDAIELFSGGNPALVTYALHACWEARDNIELDTVIAMARSFQRQRPGFRHAVHRGLGIDEDRDTAANRLWAHVEAHPGPQPRRELLELVGGTELKLEKILKLLQASGLIRVHGDVSGSHVDAEAVPSFLRPLQVATAHDTSAKQFHQDMESILLLLSRWRLGLYRDQKHEQLSREAVFTTFLASHFESSGWSATREPQQGPGYVDMWLSHVAFSEQPAAIVEVKLWTNPERAEAHEQVLSYYDRGNPDEQCMAVVMIAAPKRASDEEWRREYRHECLPDSRFEVEDLPVTKPLLDGFRARLHGEAGRDVWVRHYLLSLRRRGS